MRCSKLCALRALVTLILTVILCLPYSHCAPVAEKAGKWKMVFNTNVDREDGVDTDSDLGSNPDEYLIRFGYMKRPPDGVYLDASYRHAAIRKFQDRAGLQTTGFLDDETRDKMRQPRCGVADLGGPNIRGPRSDIDNDVNKPVNYYAPGFRWKKRDLTWRIYNYSPDIPEQWRQRQAFYEALELWSDVTPLTFREIDQGEPDIKVIFARGQHGDGYANRFDGRGGILAHAYYPENGDAHFDEDEQWTLSEEGSNLKIVAAHEFGHSLGLGHSYHPAALMAPYYRYSRELRLDYDDILGIQSLYGPRLPEPSTTRKTTSTTAAPTTTTSPTTTTQSTSTTSLPTTRPTSTVTTSTSTEKPKPTFNPAHAPNTCTSKFDAAMVAGDGFYYAFRKSWVWKLGTSGVMPGYPRPFRHEFPLAPHYVSAAVYSDRTGYTYFFRGNRVYMYRGKRFVAKKYVNNSRFPYNPDTAVVQRDQRIYLLKGSMYYLFNEYLLDMSQYGPFYIEGMWNGVPTGMDASMRLEDRYVYFFKDRIYYKYDEYKRKVVPGYPKDKAIAWMGRVCDYRAYVPY